MAASDLLSDKAIKAAETAGTASKHVDGGGLHLEARPTGSGWWRLRYRFGGKEGMLSLGTYPVPEPTSYALMGAGLLAVGAIARRRRARG